MFKHVIWSSIMLFYHFFNHFHFLIDHNWWLAPPFVSIEEKPWQLFSSIKILIHISQIIISGISILIQINLTRRQALFLNQNKTQF